MKGAQRSQLVLIRVEGLDALDRGFEGQRQPACLQRVSRMYLANFLFELDARDLVNGTAQLRRIVFKGFNDAGKNHRKVNLPWSRRRVLAAVDFLRLRFHLKTKGGWGATAASLRKWSERIRHAPGPLSSK